MKKLMALLLVALFLLSLPQALVRADGGEGAAPATQPTEKPHNKPRWSRSLAYFEQEELPTLQLTGRIGEDVLIVAQSQLTTISDLP